MKMIIQRTINLKQRFGKIKRCTILIKHNYDYR